MDALLTRSDQAGIQAQLVEPGSRLRISVIAGSRVGNAVQRNQAKRRLRAAFGMILPRLQGSCDMLILARRPVVQATYTQIISAMITLFQKAGLLHDPAGE